MNSAKHITIGVLSCYLIIAYGAEGSVSIVGGLTHEKIAQLYSDAKKADRYNLMPSIIEAVKAYATAGEMIGVIRKARGLSYDTMEMIECPFDLDENQE